MGFFVVLVGPFFLTAQIPQLARTPDTAGLVLVAHVVALAPPPVAIGGVEKASTIVIVVVVCVAPSLPFLPQRKKISQKDIIGNAATNLGIMCRVVIDAISDRIGSIIQCTKRFQIRCNSVRSVVYWLFLYSCFVSLSKLLLSRR